MGWFGRKRQDTEKEQALRRLDGKLLEYVIRRDKDSDGNYDEIVLGKGGRIMTATEDTVIMAGMKEVFRCPLAETSCGELMSHNGVMLRGVNRLSGREETLIAYYHYYRR